MTTMVNKVIITAISSSSFDRFSAMAGIIVFILLFCLLVEKEIMRAIDGIRPKIGVKVMDVVIIPLLLSFSLILGLRLLHLLHYG